MVLAIGGGANLEQKKPGAEPGFSFKRKPDALHAVVHIKLNGVSGAVQACAIQLL